MFSWWNRKSQKSCPVPKNGGKFTTCIHSLNVSGAKFQTTYVVCFFRFSLFFLTNYRLERSLYVKLKDWLSNSVHPDETAHEPSHLDRCWLQKPFIIACSSERVKMKTILTFDDLYICIIRKIYLSGHITKTRLFKYTENFTTKKWQFFR